MKILTVVGARPQFIKASPVSRALRKHHEEILAHTGQHYDDGMSAIFFRELDIPQPDINLGIGSGSHAAQTGRMMMALEDAAIAHKPDWMLVYGDTNSTLAGGLAASKLHIPIAHVEAGLRSFNRKMPEEINRVLVDHVSSRLFCPSESAVANLKNEGIVEGVVNVGDVMADVQKYALEKIGESPGILQSLNLHPNEYRLLTIHRAENTDHPERLKTIFSALAESPQTLVFPIHPRTRHAIKQMDLALPPCISLIDPVGYLDMTALSKNAAMIVTDSGGIQKEAYWLKTPCVTLRDETEWTETVEAGWNRLVGSDRESIIAALKTMGPARPHPELYGDGRAAEKIAKSFV